MNNRIKLPLFFTVLMFSLFGIAQPKPKADLLKIVDNALIGASNQYKFLMTQVPAGVLPKTYLATKKLETSSSTWWTSGFYPGSLLYLNENANDAAILKEALSRQSLLTKEQFNKGTHDLGFMMFCSFGNSNRLAPSKEYNEILMNSAKSLASRFNPITGCIKSWDHGSWKFPVIIDNMMNLELLFWATKNSGDSSYYKIAVTHANTTLKNHYREDHSSFHVVDYDPTNGNVLIRQTHQGYSDPSAWARGQAWAIYGYTMVYRETRQPRFLNHAIRIANYLLNHPRMPIDLIPYWDFDAPNIPNALRDASAATVICSALIELSGYVKSKDSKRFLKAAENQILTLSSTKYLAKLSDNGNFILKHSVGDYPRNSEVDVPLTYADYYFVEALMRYKKMKP